MNKFRDFFLAAAALALTSCFRMNASAEPATNQPPIENLKPHTFSATFRADYSLFLPKGYDAHGGKRWPVILFLHGAGERGTNIWRASTHGPTKFIEKNPDFPFILITPQCPDDRKWSDEIVLGILDSVVAGHAVDTNRIYLTGLSMGGYAAWSLATTYPERFAAVAPICGGEGNIGFVLSRMDPVRAPLLKKLPIWAFHGGKDNVIDPAESARMVDLFKRIGNNDVKLTIYPEATHNAWGVTYDNPELYQWFLQHELKPAP